MQAVNAIKYGQYYLTRKIATGGMAELFRARKVGEAGFEKLLVVKRLLPHLAEDEELRTMFLDEARLASQLTHINIAQVYDLGKARAADSTRPEMETTYFIAMEYIFGKSLAEIIRRGQGRNKPLTVENAVKIVLAAAQGMEYAHAKKDDLGRPLGLVHRDISPQNLLVSYEGEVKLVDFGIAKALNQSTTTRPGMLKGKFSYMAPEQARGAEVDQRTDVYALGVVLWETLTGRRLFAGDSEAAILGKVLDPQTSPPSSRMPGLASELDDICLKCLRPDPDDRFPNAQALCNAIESYLYGLTTYPSTYSLRNYMHEIFDDEIKAETAQIQREMEAVHGKVAAAEAGGSPPDESAPAGGPPEEPTQLYQTPHKQPSAGKAGGGKGKLFAGLAAALVVVAAAAFWLVSGTKEPLPGPIHESSPAATAPPPAPAPASPEEPAWLKKARRELGEGRYGQALQTLDQATAQNPEFVSRAARTRARALMGRAAEEAGAEPPKALADLRKAAEYDPDWAQVHFQIGRVLTRLKKFDQAEKAYERALKLDPKLDAAYFNLGYIHLQKSQFPRAVESFQRVVALPSPYKADAYVNLAVCYARMNKREKAVEMLQDALTINPNHKLAQGYLKKLAKAKGGKKP